MIVKLEFNYSETLLLCSRDTAVTCELSDISLEYDAIFDELYATAIGELYAGSTSIPYTKVTSIHYQTLSKKYTTWKIDVNNLSVRSLQGLLLLFVAKSNDFANKNQEFCYPTIKKILTKMNGVPHQIFAAGLQARDIYPELKTYFYKEHSNVTLEELLTSTDNALQGSGRTVEKSGILLQVEKAAKNNDGDLTCHVFSLADTVVHLAVSDPSRILTIEK